MITAYLLREYFPDHTRGLLVAKNESGNHVLTCVVLELPWLDNRQQESCIPEGDYLVQRRWTTKFKWHYHIQDVAGRSYILQHPGNYTSQILGCQLPGMKFKDLNADGIPDITDTRLTLNAMMAAFGQQYKLRIASWGPPKHSHTINPSTNKAYAV